MIVLNVMADCQDCGERVVHETVEAEPGENMEVYVDEHVCGED